MSAKKSPRKSLSERYASHPHTSRGLKYAEDIVKGRIPAGKYTVLTCKRQLKDLRKRKFDYKFDPDEAERVCEFIELLPHTKGQWAAKRQTISLEPWQSFVLTNAFGWLRKKDNTRRFREMNIFVPRKNGKSIFAAGIGLYMLAMDGEFGAEVYSGATTEKQAWEVFRPAKLMCDRTPDFTSEVGVEVMAKSLAVAADGSRFEPIVGTPGDGASPSCAIVDEYHEHKNPDLFDTMLTGMGSREQPIMLVITTAGSNLSGPCFTHQRELEKILDGVIEGEDRFGIIYHADTDDDWADPATLRKANPNMGVSISEDFLIARQTEAKQSTAKQNIFKTKHLNLWVAAREAFFNMLKFGKCVEPKLNIEQFSGEQAYFALDLATKSDLAAYVRLFPQWGDDGRLHFYVFCKFYLPEETVLNDKTGRYQAWMNEGLLTVTDGNEIDFEVIENDVMADLEEYSCIECLYDPWRATQLAQNLNKAGAPMVEYRQTVQMMSEPMKEMEAAVNGSRLHFDGNPIYTWMASSVVAKLDAKDNYYPRKEGGRNENKIDGIVATIMAIGRAITADAPEDLDGFLSNPIIL